MTSDEAIKLLREDANERTARIYFNEEKNPLLEAVSVLKDHCRQNAYALEKAVELDGYVKRLTRPTSRQVQHGGVEQIVVHIHTSLDTLESLLGVGD